MDNLGYLLDQLIASHEAVCGKLYAVADYQDWRPNQTEWSFRLIGAHVAKMEQESYLLQLDGIINGRGGPFTHYWNSEAELGRPELTDSIILWKERRRKLVERIKMLGADQLTLTAVHDIMGTVNVPQLIETALNHDNDHLRHLEKIMIQFDDE